MILIVRTNQALAPDQTVVLKHPFAAQAGNGSFL